MLRHTYTARPVTVKHGGTYSNHKASDGETKTYDFNSTPYLPEHTKLLWKEKLHQHLLCLIDSYVH